jgi:hypothetical protein
MNSNQKRRKVRHFSLMTGVDAVEAKSWGYAGAWARGRFGTWQMASHEKRDQLSQGSRGSGMAGGETGS